MVEKGTYLKKYSTWRSTSNSISKVLMFRGEKNWRLMENTHSDSEEQWTIYLSCYSHISLNIYLIYYFWLKSSHIILKIFIEPYSK